MNKSLSKFVLPILAAASMLNASAQGTVTDIDGNIYATLIIGSQEWMAENLRTTKLNDGTPIDRIIQNRDWTMAVGPGRAWYNNDSIKYHARYGFLYNGYAVLTDKICPQGWKIPTDTEWDQMMTALGGSEVAGGKMKTTGTSDWEDPNEGATNSSGFSGLPGGWRSQTDGSFQFQGFRGGWWITSGRALMFRFLSYSISSCGFGILTEKAGVSVRCMNARGATSTDNFEKNFPIALFPNPAREILTIQAPDGSGMQSCVIFSADGKQLKSFTIHAGATRIDISDLKPGLYLVKVKGTLPEKVFKLIVQP